MIKHNIKTLPKDTLINCSLRLQMDIQKPLKEWLADAKVGGVNCKHRSLAKGLAEFKKLYEVKEFYMCYVEQTPWYKDDSIEIRYKTK